MALVQPADMAVKANEILARFRPIAPKPPSAMPTMSPPQVIGGAATSRVLSHLQARPCRARKRGRPSVAPPVSPPAHAAARRKRSAVPYPAPLLGCAAATEAVVSTATRAGMLAGSACLSLAPASASAGNLTRLSTEMAAEEDDRDVPVERDLLRKLLEPKVISPRAVRPVGSTIHVLEPISVGAGTDNIYAASSKTAQEVEAELEADALPAFVSDSSNRVRLVNDAYKEMVGAPECSWLGAVAAAAASRRISGEVTLVMPAAAMIPESQNGGFSCAAKIEWERGGERASVHAACGVTRLHCESRDYLFAWRLRTADASPSSVSHRADK